MLNSQIARLTSVPCATLLFCGLDFKSLAPSTCSMFVRCFSLPPLPSVSLALSSFCVSGSSGSRVGDIGARLVSCDNQCYRRRRDGQGERAPVCRAVSGKGAQVEERLPSSACRFFAAGSSIVQHEGVELEIKPTALTDWSFEELIISTRPLGAG